MTDARRAPHPELVLRVLPPGAAVVYRDYDDPRREAKAALLRAIAARRRLVFLVAGDPDLALRLEADGLHLRADDLKRPLPRDARQARGGGRLLSASCHDGAELALAGALGADIAFVSPVFATQSHAGAAPLGPRRFLALAAASPVPVLALGGVGPENARRLAGAGVAGLAAVGAFLG